MLHLKFSNKLSSSPLNLFNSSTNIGPHTVFPYSNMDGQMISTVEAACYIVLKRLVD